MNPLSLGYKILIVGLAAAFAMTSAANVLLWLNIRSLEHRLETCQTDKAEAFGRIQVQNDGIADLKRQAVAAQAAASAALARAEDAEKANRGLVSARQRAIAAPSGGKTCGDALRAIREGLRP